MILKRNSASHREVIKAGDQDQKLNKSNKPFESEGN